jgi:DNA-binding transcriptional regulator/RsmH inhibitor MraZ
MSSVRASNAEVRTVDPKGRVILPKGFANATVQVEAVSDTEVRIRKAVVLPEADLPFVEETLAPLSNRDRDRFLELIDSPPDPNPAFRAAAARYKKRHG